MDRAERTGYWFERDCQREATRLEGSPDGMGMGWSAKALARILDMTESKNDGGKVHEPPWWVSVMEGKCLNRN